MGQLDTSKKIALNELKIVLIVKPCLHIVANSATDTTTTTTTTTTTMATATTAVKIWVRPTMRHWMHEKPFCARTPLADGATACRCSKTTPQTRTTRTKAKAKTD